MERVGLRSAARICVWAVSGVGWGPYHGGDHEHGTWNPIDTVYTVICMCIRHNYYICIHILHTCKKSYWWRQMYVFVHSIVPWHFQWKRRNMCAFLVLTEGTMLWDSFSGKFFVEQNHIEWNCQAKDRPWFSWEGSFAFGTGWSDACSLPRWVFDCYLCCFPVARKKGAVTMLCRSKDEEILSLLVWHVLTAGDGRSLM